MSVETGNYLSALDASKPGTTDLKAEGDDHLRFIKAKLLQTFPNVTGAVTPTHTELNYSVGVTSALQTQLNTLTTNQALKAPAASPTFTGLVTVSKAGTAYANAVQLESGATGNTQYSPAITFSASNVNAAIYSTRLSSFGGRLVLATQGTGGGDPAARFTLTEAGNAVLTGTFATASGLMAGDGGGVSGAAVGTSLPVGTIVVGATTGCASCDVLGTQAMDGSSNFVTVTGPNNVSYSITYGTWRALGKASAGVHMWIRAS